MARAKAFIVMVAIESDPDNDVTIEQVHEATCQYVNENDPTLFNQLNLSFTDVGNVIEAVPQFEESYFRP